MGPCEKPTSPGAARGASDGAVDSIASSVAAEGVSTGAVIVADAVAAVTDNGGSTGAVAADIVGASAAAGDAAAGVEHVVAGVASKVNIADTEAVSSVVAVPAAECVAPPSAPHGEMSSEAAPPPDAASDEMW